MDGLERSVTVPYDTYLFLERNFFFKCFCTVITLPVPITCFSFHDIYLTCHGFMGCFVLVADGRREQQRQKAHNNSIATVIMTLEKQHFFSSFYKTVRNLHWVSLLLIIALLSRLDKNASKKNKTCRKKQKVLL